MENKYYKPNISELGLNFEYEELTSYVLADISNGEYRQISEHCEWLEKKVTLNDLSNILKPQTKDSQGGLFYKLTSDNIRVKYLDQSDIEELGFKCTATYDSYKLYENVDYTKIIKDNNIVLEEANKAFTIKAEDTFITIRNWADYDIIYFQGVIKNKSELKKLLKQLNIK